MTVTDDASTFPAPRTRAEARAAREQASKESVAGPRTVERRVTWIDAARAGSVLAVVAFHVGFVNFYPLVKDDPNVATKAWMRLGDLLALVRMPMLLTVSGLLAATKVRSGLTPRTIVSAVSNYYLYLVWLVIYALTVPPVVTDLSVSGPLNLLKQALLPMTTLWFVWLLAIGVAGLAALRSVNRWAVLGCLVLLGMGVEAIPHERTQLWMRAAPLVVYLAFGVYASDWLRANVARARTGLASLAGVVLLVPLYLALPVPNWVKYPVRTLAGFACALLIMWLAAFLVRWRPLERLGSWVGRRTLPIYVIHFPMVAGLGLLPESVRAGLGRALSGSVPLALVYPAVLVALLAAASLGLEALAQRLGLGALFEMPRPWRERLAAAVAHR